MIQIIKFAIIAFAVTVFSFVVLPVCIINWEWRVYKMIFEGADEAVKIWVFNKDI